MTMREVKTIPDLFEMVVREHGGRVALAGGGRCLTYQELQAHATALAAQLVASGVTTETVVAVFLRRSIELPVALLGVLKAGGTYVCLDPEHPAERLRQILTECGAAVIVTEQPSVPAAAAFGLPVIQIPDEPPPAGAFGADPAPTCGDALAYVIYTSGSTGRPKGVGITHRNLLSLVRNQTYANFGPHETFLQLSPLSFDASAFEIWGALLTGARLVVPEASYRALDRLPDVLRTERVTMLLLTPALFQEVHRRRIDAFATVRRLIVGAEAMALPVARDYLADARSRNATFANVYGPTEATTLVSCYEITDLDAPDASIPIGLPIEGSAVYLLDADLAPVGSGAVGQLYLGGHGIARGYLGQPGLTASRFVADPFAATPGSRMYATGDLGRRRADGHIDFLGREDGQVKIRGFRVELGEVEEVLARHPQVSSVVVTVRRTNLGSQQLVAHVVADDPGDGSLATDLAHFAADQLPAYLRPSAIDMVASLPLTPSGKVDRRALAEQPVAVQRSLSPSPSPDMTAGEQVLTRIWREVLGTDDIGPDDDFFALGGDSLLAIRVVTDAEEANVPIALADLFSTPTIRALAGALAPAVQPMPPDHVPDAEVTPLADPTPVAGAMPGQYVPLAFGPEVEAVYPATQLQLGLLFEAEAHPDTGMYVDVITRRIVGPFDEAIFVQALRQTLLRHPALRTTFDLSTSKEPLQLVRREPVLDLRVADERGVDEARIKAALAQAESAASAPFAPDVALIRFRIVQVAEAEFQLIYGFHHAVMDGWSESVFGSELLRCYDALLGGEELRLPAIGTGFVDYVGLEQQALRSTETRQYWTRRCASLRAWTVGTGTDRADAARLRLTRPVPSEIVTGLRLRSRDWKVPYKSLLTAGHLAALSHAFTADEPVTGLIVNGRPEAPGSDQVVGLFLNVLPVSGRITEDWRTLVGSVFDQEKEMLPHRRFPYPALRALAGKVLFDVAMNYVRFHRDDGLDALTRLHVGASRILDKTSFSLAFDLVRSPDGDGLSIEATADSQRFGADELSSIVQAHLDAYRAIARDLPLKAAADLDA